MKKKYVLCATAVAGSIVATSFVGGVIDGMIDNQKFKRQSELTTYVNNENIVELDALKEQSDTTFTNTKEIIDALENIPATILHVGEFYVSSEGGPISVVNYYGECKMQYQEGDEIPFGCYVDKEGYLVQNCVPTPIATEEGVIYTLPSGYTLKQEIVTEESISYQDFLAYDIESLTTTNPITEEEQITYHIY